MGNRGVSVSLDPINPGVLWGQVLFLSGVPALQSEPESPWLLADGVPPQRSCFMCLSESTSLQSGLHLQPWAHRSIPFS